MNKELTGSELVEALEEGNFDSSPIKLNGIVKESGKKEIKFSQFSCENWVTIPISIIEKAEFKGHHSCKDHSHPIVQITLKNEVDNDYSKALSSLLKQVVEVSPETPAPMETTNFQNNRQPFGLNRLGLFYDYPRPRNCDDCELLLRACIASGGSLRNCWKDHVHCQNNCW